VIVRSTQEVVLGELAISRAVLLKALPRSGRTALSVALIKELADGSVQISGEECVRRQPQEIYTSYAGCTVFVDAIQIEQVSAIETVVRRSQELGRSAPKFVLVGRNAKVEQILSGALTGIIAEVELPPIQVLEHFYESKPLNVAQSPVHMATPEAQATNLPDWGMEVLWLRGGLPESLYAGSDEYSFAWRTSYLNCMLNQDFSCWNIDASDRLPEVFQFVANNNGEQFDDAKCANTLSVKRDSVRKSLNLLYRKGLLRRLPNWPPGSDQSLDSMPVYYVRDCGLLHAALGICTQSELRGSSAIGHSWESFAIEAIINAVQGRATPTVYRDKSQNEIDLVLNFSDGSVAAIECKVNEKKSTRLGFATACKNIKATRKLLVHSGEADKPSKNGASSLSLLSAIRSFSR
jgi:predicted AAA+ superfamily ATPase